MSSNAYDDLKGAIASSVLIKKANARIINADEESLADWIFDFRAILLQPQWLNRYADIFWERYASQYPFQVCGMESAAISLVAAIVMKGVERGTPVNGLFVRKSRKRQGLLKQIEGTPTNDRIILVDDLINSGSTFNKQIKILTAADARVSDMFALLAFRDTSTYTSIQQENSIKLQTLFTLKDFDLPLLSPSSPKIPSYHFDTIWKFSAPHPSYNHVVQKSSPILDDHHVYFGTDIGDFFALDQTDGKIVWTYEIGKHPPGKGIFSSPTLCKGLVYFGGYDGNVYALDAATGTKKWTYSDADWIGSSPALAPNLNLVFIGLEFGLFKKRGGIAALNANTGALVWRDTTAALTHGSPLYIREENMVVIGSNDSVVYAYQADTGEMLWRFPTNGAVKSSLAYDPKRRLVFAGSLGGTLYALSARDGNAVFAREMNAGIYSTPIVHNDTVYVTSLDKCVYAIDLNTWKDEWSFATLGRIFASPVIIGGSLWCGSNDGRLYEIHKETGKLVDFFQASERITNRISYNEKSKKFFVLTQANELYCLTKNENDTQPHSHLHLV